MRRTSSKRAKVAATVMAMLLITTFVASFIPKATTTPTTIAFIDPEIGHVGDIVRIIGEINTTNGLYGIFFDEEEVRNGTALDRAVNDTFVVPHRPMGNYTVKLHDVAANTNDTKVFTVQTAYYVEAVVPQPPRQLQEGDLVKILVNVTGGAENTRYWANITVTDPSGTVYYNETLQLTNTTDTGHGTGSITYPTDFGAGAHTNYTGLYRLAFNKTLASGNFTVGLTNATQYYRFQVVGIQATGYQSNESVWVNITFAGKDVVSFTKNASVGGVIEAGWEIPWNASMGLYTVTLTNSTAPGTVKPVPDTQNFTVTEKIIPVSIYPTNGPWGTNVRVVGEIIKPGGSYQIKWDYKPMKTGNCTLGSMVVNDTFIVPPSIKGYHNITLQDVNQTTESMPATFEITTSCYVYAEPTRILEGLAPEVTVGVREAKANATYTFKINVTDPLNRTWSANIFVTTTKDGSGENFIKYGGATNCLGTYSITVNETLAAGNFTAGITDELEYRRTNRVIIQGAGYNATRDVTINITKGGVSVKGYPKNVTTILEGVVTDLWTIPDNATLGIYTVTLTNATTGKVKRPIPDIQNFTVIEIIIHCQTRNKYDKEPLAGVSVEVLSKEAPVTSGKTNKTGWVEFRLDRGNVTFEAFWKGVQVGILENQSITGNVTEYVLQKIFNVECELARVTIAIKDEADPPNPLPFINVTLTSNKTGTLSFETNYTGIIATNTFTNTSYTIEARRYGHLFNKTSIENLTITRSIDITCPTYTLFVYTLDSKRLPLQNVQVAVYEWSSERLIRLGTTNDWGSVAINCTFGRYKVRVMYNYSVEPRRTIILNESVLDLIENPSFFVIHCRISNLDLSLRLVDCFEQPIPNALVKLEREFEQEYVNIANLTTGPDGTVLLPKIGGNYRISVYVSGKLCETKTLYLDETEVVVFKLEKYIAVAGYPLETTQLIAFISLGVLVALLALALIYKRLRVRKAHGEEKKEKSL